MFQLMDFYAASGLSLLWCVFFQTIAICWVFGAKKFYLCIEEMIGYRVSWYWYVCWVFLAPAFMVVSTIDIVWSHVFYHCVLIVHLCVLLCEILPHHYG